MGIPFPVGEKEKKKKKNKKIKKRGGGGGGGGGEEEVFTGSYLWWSGANGNGTGRHEFPSC